jgi:hypothetical protein
MARGGPDGKANGVADILSEEIIDFTNVVLAGGDEQAWQGDDFSAREKLILEQHKPAGADPNQWEIDVANLDARVDDALRWLLDMAILVAAEHNDEATHPKIVVCLHGGIRNFLTKKWYGKYATGDPRDYHTCQMGNLALNVFHFSDPSKAELVEVQDPESVGYYAKRLGEYYVQTKDLMQEGYYKERFGIEEDQRASHIRFINGSIKSTRDFKEKAPEMFKVMVMWVGEEGLMEKWT